MTTYNLDTYERTAMPRSFSRERLDLIGYALERGWTVTKTAANTVRLVAQDGTEKVIKLTSDKNSHPTASYQKMIDRHATRTPAPRTILQDAMEIALKRAEEKDKIQQQREEEEFMMNPEATVVYEGPMRSRMSRGREYESKIATEVEYDDGSVEFLCVKCDYIGAKPLQMSGHWRKHVIEDEANKSPLEGGALQKASIPVELTSTRAYAPSASRLASLKDELLDLIQSGTLDWTDPVAAADQLALRSLEWDHSREGIRGPQEPLTDSQILQRIRSLVDGGASDRVAELEAELAEVTEQRDRARGDLHALRELITGMGE